MFITEHRRKVKTANVSIANHVRNLITQGHDIRTTTGFRVRTAHDINLHEISTMYIHAFPDQTSTIPSKTARTSIHQPCPKCSKTTFKAVKLNGETPAMFCESCRHVDYATTFQGSEEPKPQSHRYTIEVGDNAAVELKAVN